MAKEIKLRVTQASLNQTAFDWPRNMANIFAAIDEAVAQGSDVLALEELTLTGYDAGDDFQKTDNVLIVQLLQEIAAYAAQKNPNLVISVGHPFHLSDKAVPAGIERRKHMLFNRGNLPFNVQSFISQDRIVGMTAKSYLFNYERGYEKRYFQEWSVKEANDIGGKDGSIFISLPGQDSTVPFGRPIIRLRQADAWINLAHIICEEKWVASRYDDPSGTDDGYEADGVAPALARQVGKAGLLLLIPDASPPAPHKMAKHEHLAVLASQYADAVIDTDGLGSSGSGFAQYGFRVVAQDSKIVSRGQRLHFGRVATTTTDLRLATADPRMQHNTHAVVTHDFHASKPELITSSSPQWESKPETRLIEETVRMTCLWLFDYMRKTKSQGIMQALSGGADSGFNATMVAVMVRLAMRDLGVSGFCHEMSHLRYTDQIKAAFATGGTEAAVQTCLSHMLTCVYMGTDNSSAQTLAAARLLSEGGSVDGQAVTGIGGVFQTRTIQDLVNLYALVYAVEDTTKLAPDRKIALLHDIAGYLHQRPGSVSMADLYQQAAALRRRYPEITGVLISAADPRHAIAYENLQAAVRQALIMRQANIENKMAVANPNLDEARNAYATFGGDLHSGTINLNGHLSKEEEYAIMQHLHDHGLEGVPAVKALGPMLKGKLEPTAELQPKSADGKVVQSDVTALQRDFAQMKRISELMLHERTGPHRQRRLNPSEVFQACQQEICFKGVDDTRLYNMVRFSYLRWGVAQHKIHASPLAPTFGSNVDHQVSLRTPNLSGQDRAELTQLGIKLLFARARRENTAAEWSAAAEKQWVRRALLDEGFVDRFEALLRHHRRDDLTFDLSAVYAQATSAGMKMLFGNTPR